MTSESNLRILCVGSRGFHDGGLIHRVLSALYEKHPLAVVVHGAARGADHMCGHAAQQIGFLVEAFPAQWTKYGRHAGFKRNHDMVKSLDKARGDFVLAFWDGKSRGTLHSITLAEKAGLPVTRFMSNDGGL